MPQNTKGTRRERELANEFDAHGFAVTREPASGSATKRKLPDLHVGRAYDVDREAEFGVATWVETIHDNYALEAKSSCGDPIYIGKHEIEGLTWYAEQFDARPGLAVKFDVKHGDPDYGEDSNGWYFLNPEDCHRTPEGNYRVKKEEAHENGIPFDVLVSRIE